MEYKYKCDVCGRPLKKKCSLKGYTLCSKHMHQLFKHGAFLDSIQRTTKDPNDYVIDGSVARFSIYNQKNIKIGEFIIDKEDVEKVRNHKWRLSHNHVLTGREINGVNNVKDLAWIVLGIDDIGNDVVDHINHNPLDNRKSNLRICSQSENTKNCSLASKNTSGYAGVHFDKRRNKWNAEIKVEYKKIYLGSYRSLNHAVYARLIAEALYFDDYKNEEEFEKKLADTHDIDYSVRKAICERITNKFINYQAYQLR